MEPVLREGDWALAIRSTRLRVGDVIVVEHPERSGYEMVKRLVRGPGEVRPDGGPLGPGEWWVEGEATDASTDSRAFGPVRRAAIKGRIRLVYWPLSRVRVL